MSDIVSFFVPGAAKTKGSWIPVPRGNKTIMIPDNKKSKNWQRVIADYARVAYRGKPVTGAVILDTKFYLPRPKSHYGTGRNIDTIKASSPEHPILHSTGDLDKLVRCVWDALTGIIYVDDSQVCGGEIKKEYATGEAGVMVIIGMK